MTEVIPYILLAVACAAVFAFGWFSINPEDDE